MQCVVAAYSANCTQLAHMLCGSWVMDDWFCMAWRVFRIRMEKTASRYGWQLRIYRSSICGLMVDRLGPPVEALRRKQPLIVNSSRGPLWREDSTNVWRYSGPRHRNAVKSCDALDWHSEGSEFVFWSRVIDRRFCEFKHSYPENS
jgi:hypothetical protein